MKPTEIYSLETSGAWCSAYMSHHEDAWYYYTEYTLLIEKLNETEKQLRKNSENCESVIRHLTNTLTSDSYRAASSAHRYACLTIEGFLNFYGVKRLGEQYYKKKILKKPLIEKLTCLFDILFKKSPDSAFSERIHSIFQLRNDLVHPKTQEVNSSNRNKFVNPHPRDHHATRAIDVLELFADEMCLNDPKISKSFYFPKYDPEE